MKTDLSKTKVRKCNTFLLTLLYGGVRAYCFLGGIRLKKVNKCAEKIEEPAVILCNHGSFIDFIYAASLCWKHKPHFVVARLYFYHKFLGGLLRILGSFPKSMFAMDMESTKNCLKVLRDGEVLVMMPEARLSTVGKFEDIQESTYSFLKKSGAPVYTVKLCGSYLADPKWGKSMRRGARVEATLEQLFTAADLDELSAEQIKAAVEERLYYNEFEWLETKPDIKYKNRNLAEGLENILSVCPVCGGKHTIIAKGREISCANCGRLTSLNSRYAFEEGFRFKNFAEWYEWQKAELEKEILGNENYELVSKVELRLPGTGKTLTRSAGEGVCTLNRDGLTYKGTRDGEDYEINFTLKKAYRLLFGAGENFEIYNGTEILYFVPEVKQSAVDWYMASMILHDTTVTE